ncbi:hypothetical protein BC739_009412 [Kutzneria viridogrisea]|uniref:Uncharacterized protein n=1 Tax=Kutzneria viridogrisea TaxID=47990 RepID=A0ABR6BZ07_9PSEU|nr:hypothetical protein [Kutzneria viridogrisea]
MITDADVVISLGRQVRRSLCAEIATTEKALHNQPTDAPHGADPVDRQAQLWDGLANLQQVRPLH